MLDAGQVFLKSPKKRSAFLSVISKDKLTLKGLMKRRFNLARLS
jgi:hypothetical protein